MNNRGQVFVLFILLLPVLFILFAYVIDKCYLLYQENSQKDIGNIVCSYLTDTNKTDNDIKQLALENDSKLENIKIIRSDKQVTVTLEKKIDSLFGKLFGISKYEIKTKTKCVE